MSGRIINESTSVIQIDTSGLQNSMTAVVYVSSTTIPGQLVTVIDSTGYLSSPQSILLSTVGTATLAGGGFIQQRYGYISLISEDTNTWHVINCNSFPTSSPAVYLALDSFAVQASTIHSYDHISSIDARDRRTDIFLSAHTLGQTFASSMNVNSYTAYLSTSTTDPRLRIWGDAKVYGSTNTIGTLNIRGIISTTGNLNVGANVSSKLGTIYVGGDVTTSGNIRGQRGNQMTVQALSTFGLARFNLRASIDSTTTVAGPVSARIMSTSETAGNFLNATSSITIGTTGQAIQYRRGFMNLLNLPITTPSMSTNFLTASNGLITSNLEFQSFGPASTLQELTLSTAQITNANGSIAISSIDGQTLETNYLYSPSINTTGQATFNTINMNDASYSESTIVLCPPYTSVVIARPVIPLYWTISSTGTAGTFNAPKASFSTNLLAAAFVVADTFNTTLDYIENDRVEQFNLSSMTVTDTVRFSTATLLSIKNAHFQNVGGTIRGTNTKLSSYLYISTIHTDLISASNTIEFTGANRFTMSTAIVSSIQSDSIVTSSFAFVNGSLGSPMQYSTINPSTPWLQASTFNMNNPPFTTTSGLGTYFSETAFSAAENQDAYYTVINPLAVPSVLDQPYINTVVGRGTSGYTSTNGTAASNASIGYVVGQPAIDASQNLFFGTNVDAWRIQKIDTAGQISTVAGNPQFFYGDGQYPTEAALGPKLAVSVLSPGVTLITDVSNVRLRLVDQTPIIYTIAGSGGTGYPGDGGLAFSTIFNNPGMTAPDSAGNIFVADTSNNMIRIINLSSIYQYAGSTISGASGDGGQASLARFAGPYGVAVNSSDLLYITDTSNCVVRTVDPMTTVIDLFAGSYTSGFSGDGGPATSAQLSYPRGITTDVFNNVYVCDTSNDRIRRIDFTTNIISTIAGNGSNSFSGNGIPGYLAALSSPTGVTTDNNGNLYIADTNNHCIRFLNVQTGIITTVAGRPMRPGYFGNNTFANTALLSSPSQVAYDRSSGYYYIADEGNRRVRFVDSATGVIYDYVGNGSPLSLTDKVPVSRAVFGNIASLATDLQNNIYIADGPGNTISKIDISSGLISTVVGTGLSAFSVDGPAITTAISTPRTAVVDSSNNLLFCDTNNHRIRKYISTTKRVQTIAGTGVANYSGDGGYASTASLNSPKALALDLSGNIYIGDSSNYRIRRVDAKTGIITTVAGVGTAGAVTHGESAVSSQIGFVTALATDPTKTLYFTDLTTNGLWQISQIDGTFQPMNTISTASYLGDAGPLSNAQFNQPMGLITDVSGNFTVCDSGNYRIRRSYTYGIPQTPAYLNMYLTFTNYYATSGSVNIWVNGNNIASFNTSSINSTLQITDQNIHSYPLQNSNPVLGNQQPYIQILTEGNVGYMKLEGNIWVNQVTAQGFLQNKVDSENGIIMNSGTLDFPYTNNGITIENKYNDASTRTFRYTGSLFNASDPALKERIQAANLGICYETLVQIPLRTYNYIPAYQSTFHVHDRTRLGFLTSEVAPFFPNSVSCIPFEHTWAASSIQTLDTAQIKYAHLGTTQLLIEEVSTLEAQVVELDSLRKIMRMMATQRNVVL